MFFPGALQKFLLFLPFQYVSYVPAMVYIGRYTLAGVSMPIPQIVGLQAIAVAVTAIISEYIYRLSMKRFTGVGA